jgi:outer membrane PBP1 activator LpoA protein
MIALHRAAVLLACVVAWPALCVASGGAASARSLAQYGNAMSSPAAGLPGAPPAQPPSPSVAAAREAPFIALLLPLEAPDFAAPAGAVVEGCRAALQSAGNRLALQVLRTDASPAGTLSAYQAAAERGAAVIVGPMTRDTVTALTESRRAAAPTLLLNSPEGEGALPAGYYSFGLSVEQEARLIARAAIAAGHRTVAVVEARSPLARRMSQAFVNEWMALGGGLPDVEDFAQGDNLRLLHKQLLSLHPDVIFLSGDAVEARTVAPYLPRNEPIYAASIVQRPQVAAVTNLDLEGVHIFQMPWLVQPDHPAVMVYPRPETIPDGMQRFYALGIDACRLAQPLARHQEDIDLDGVTGRIRMGSDGVFEREPVASVFHEGLAVPEPGRP